MNYQPSITSCIMTIYPSPSPLFYKHVESSCISLIHSSPFRPPSMHTFLYSRSRSAGRLIFPNSLTSTIHHTTTQLQTLVSAIWMFMTSTMILLSTYLSLYRANVSLPHVYSDPHSNLPGNHYLLHAGQTDPQQKAAPLSKLNARLLPFSAVQNLVAFRQCSDNNCQLYYSQMYVDSHVTTIYLLNSICTYTRFPLIYLLYNI